MHGFRVYGPGIGNGSNARVAAGISQALRELGRFDGFFPIDAYDEEIDHAGAQARYGVYVGPPRGVPFIRHGFHERRFAIVAPNSTWLPDELFETVVSHAEIVVPSRWAVSIVESCGHETPSVFRHGVSAAFRRTDDMSQIPPIAPFRVLHLSSTACQRKGTDELLNAWGEFCRSVMSEARPKLTVVVERGAARVEAKAVSCCPPGSVEILSRLNLNDDEMAAYYRRFHIVCQPSRGEGFGLVPLEALCCGVPVVATARCTGHAEHLLDQAGKTRHGVVDVRVGELAPIDDGPGALAPSLASEDILDALTDIYKFWPSYLFAARARADELAVEWSWKAVTERWLDQIGAADES